MRIGFGYDVHAFEKGRKLILGGVEVPYKMGLLGHSDADVLLHAVIDALIGAMGEGDIGRHFPDTDMRYKDISSKVLLSEIAELLKSKEYIIGNIDSTIVIQEPKLSEYVDDMRKNIAEVLKIEIDQINVKAKTEEKLGFTGTNKGVKAYAVCLIHKKV